jgi:type II secretory pathway pseudopilin PulG
MVIAVMAIMMAAAMQLVSFQEQREREAELIFRGQQYVEGIRLYRQKYGRYPMRMKELWEADPRVLRQKWTDPITRSEEWGVIFQGEEGRELVAPGGGGLPPTPTRTPVFERDREGEGEKVGPIVGVHSLSTQSSIKVYEGRDQYDLWKFVLKKEGSAPGGGGGGGETPGIPTPVRDRTGTPNK